MQYFNSKTYIKSSYASKGYIGLYWREYWREYWTLYYYEYTPDLHKEYVLNILQKVTSKYLNKQYIWHVVAKLIKLKDHPEIPQVIFILFSKKWGLSLLWNIQNLRKMSLWKIYCFQKERTENLGYLLALWFWTLPPQGVFDSFCK